MCWKPRPCKLLLAHLQAIPTPVSISVVHLLLAIECSVASSTMQVHNLAPCTSGDNVNMCAAAGGIISVHK